MRSIDTEGLASVFGTSTKNYKIVNAKDAKKNFQNVVSQCTKLIPEQALHLKELNDSFSMKPANQLSINLFLSTTDKQNRLKLLRIQFLKKPKECFIGYEIFDLVYSIAPSYLVITTHFQSSSSQSLGVSVCRVSISLYSSSYSSSTSTEHLKQKENHYCAQIQNLLNKFAQIEDPKKKAFLRQLEESQQEIIDY